MDINEILNGVKCSCGKHHTCPIDKIFVEKGAISHLSELCQQYSKALIVADGNTYKAAGKETEKALFGKELTRVIFDGSTVLIPDEKAIAEVEKYTQGQEIIIGIGSGVIQDLCKYVSHFNKIPYMVVATAPSMDGYASSGAAMILKGMKETVPAGLPKAIVADTEVLRNAPMEMIKAGFGDIIGKYSALNDWKLATIVNGEYFCDYIYNVTYEMIEKTLKTAKGLLNREEESVKAVTEALMIVGIMMSFATNSRPASGSEHHLSHFFEITGIVKNEPYFAHGIDVFYSTYVTAQIREKLLEISYPKFQFVPNRQEYEKDINEAYGVVGSGCIALQDKLGTYKKDRGSVYNSMEKKIKAVLSKMPTAKEIESMLKMVELDLDEFYKLYGEDKINTAIKYAKDLKDRYTVLWMYYDILGENL